MRFKNFIPHGFKSSFTYFLFFYCLSGYLLARRWASMSPVNNPGKGIHLFQSVWSSNKVITYLKLTTSLICRSRHDRPLKLSPERSCYQQNCGQTHVSCRLSQLFGTISIFPVFICILMFSGNIMTNVDSITQLSNYINIQIDCLKNPILFN